MNYAKLVNKILEIGIKEPMINYTGYGNIYNLNIETINDYPIFWVYNTSGVTMDEDLITAHLYLVYLDRLTNRVDDDNIENLLIENAAQNVLWNIVRKIENLDVEIVNESLDFVPFEGLETKSDVCYGGFIQVDVRFANDNSCIVN